MIVIPKGEWELECSGEVFARVRDTPEFAFLVTLGRVINAVKFGIEAHRHWSDDGETPRAERQRLGSLLYLAAALHEVLELKRTVEQDAGANSAAAAVFGVFSEDKLDRQFAEDLRRIRNRGAFHFDSAVAQQSLSKFPAEPFTFITSVGVDPMDANYELADIVSVTFMFGSGADVPKLNVRLSTFKTKLDRLLLDFVSAADQYLFKRLTELGFRLLERPGGSFAVEREGPAPDAPAV
jgi:hypothetical protein